MPQEKTGSMPEALVLSNYPNVCVNFFYQPRLHTCPAKVATPADASAVSETSQGACGVDERPLQVEAEQQPSAKNWSLGEGEVFEGASSHPTPPYHSDRMLADLT